MSRTPACPDCGWLPDGELWPTEGPRAVWWIQKYIICGEGDWYGKPMVLRPDQKRSLYRWYEWCGGCGRWRYSHWVRTEATGGGKTTLMGAVGTLEVGGPPEIVPVSPDVVMAANSWDQANKLFGAASIMCGGSGRKVRESPLRDYFEVYDSKIVRADGKPGLIERVAAVAGTNEGGLPSTFMCDEVHELGELGETGRARMHVVIGKSTNKRQLRCEIPVRDPETGEQVGIRTVQRGPGRIIDISTAGFDVDHSFMGGLYQHGKEVLKDPGLNPRLLFECWEADEGLDFEVEADRYAAVRQASPAAGILWNPADRVNEWRNPKMPDHEWGRYYGNRWEKIPEDSWLKEHPAAWGKCKGTWTLAGTEPTVLAVDMSLTRDSTAVDECVMLPDGRIAVTARIWLPTGGRIDHREVYTYLKERGRELGDRFRGVVYDPRFFELLAKMLEEDEGLAVIEFDQSPILMAPAVGETFDMIIAAQIVQDGDDEFGRQVLAAAKRQQERGFTLSKGKSKRRIDATVSMCMGVHVLKRLAKPVNLMNTMW